MRSRMILSLVVIVVLLTSVGGATAHTSVNAPTAPQAALGSGFTFQGQLKNANNPVNGNCDMTFRLYDAAATGTQIGSTITATVSVSNSLFTVMLNTSGEYGANTFNGEARWLEVSVKCAGDSSFTTLTPRQQITASPYAQYALTGNNIGNTPYVPLMWPQTLDLATLDTDLKAFGGSFTDGRYGYLVPYNNGSTPSGKVVRVDLQNFITATATVLDLATIDSSLVSFLGGFTDGQYGYLVPYGVYPSPHHGKLVRIDLQNFTASGVAMLDLTGVDADLKGFDGGFTDGRYGYLVPYNKDGGEIMSGKAARVDLQNFTLGGVTVLDFTTIDPTLKGFIGGFTDGRYGYYVPYSNGFSAWIGKVVRVDLQNFGTSGVTVLDLTSVDSNLKGFQGGFMDGHYGYFVPYGGAGFGGSSGKIARLDLQNFTPSGVTALDLTSVNSGLRGFEGGFTDGSYGYFVPIYDGSAYSGKLARVDLQNFTPSGVKWLDMAMRDSSLVGFSNGFTDAHYGYFVPNAYSKLARIQLFSGVGSP